LGGDQQAAQILSKVEISFLGEANAADTTTDAAQGNSADAKPKGEAKSSTDAGPEVKDKKALPKTWSDEEVALFTKLEERKAKLDAREAQLAKLEEDLQKQKDDLEGRLASLEEVRGKIAARLEDKVKV